MQNNITMQHNNKNYKELCGLNFMEIEVEVELRSFITKEQYDFFLNFFKANGKLLYDDDQETHYLDTVQSHDLRIQKNNHYSKIWLKKGKLHDMQREEIEVKYGKEDFDKISKIFREIGIDTKIKWFRKRHAFDWDGVSVALDYTKGYGYIIELEKMASDDEKDACLDILKQKMKELNLELTPKEEFDKAYNYYKDHWQQLTE